ncbi:hypothetical protein BDV96DRAFT_679713 [Lophiotrema nucula]|uniref:Uncharacterized protein n=1 Tax=Lophiotrema nucula TaxID=690887 RepID=A0A6A5ZEB1_9PLEO|nr:hypothetical protein BDV96DRAFT_679713 [Lophiotrema nucula]
MTQALEIVSQDTNRKMGTILVDRLGRPDRIGILTVGPDLPGQDEFKFQITIRAENPEEGNMEWGLSQNLIHSTRLACYQDGSCMNTRPTNNQVPILDGGADIIPWFDNDAFETLPADGSTIQVAITDGPQIDVADNIYLSAQGAGGPTSPLQAFTVDETFRISLTSKKTLPDGTNMFGVVFQCDWSYSYTFNTLSDGQTTTPTATTCVERNPEAPILSGPVATESAFRQYNPDTNKPFNEVRFTEGRNPEDPQRRSVEFRA